LQPQSGQMSRFGPMSRLLFLHLSFLLSFPSAFAGEFFVFKEFVVTGNRVTNQSTIEREVALVKGGHYSSVEIDSLVKRSVHNLQRLQLFNRVSAEPVFTENENFFLRIEVSERWYWWPRVFFEVAEPNFNIWWQERDFSRANYGLELYKQNFRGRNEDLFLSAKVGYANRVRFYYRKPWFSPRSAWGLVAEAYYSEQEEVNIGTINHERIFYRVPGKIGLTERLATGGVTYRPKIHTMAELTGGFVSLSVQDSLVSDSPNYFNNETSDLTYIKLAVRLRHDTRDNPGYPLQGCLLETMLIQRGLGLLNNETLNQTEWHADARYHVPIRGRWYAAAAAIGKINLAGQVPYAIQRGLGYHDLVRGYERVVIDGQSYALLSTNVKFAVIPKKNVNLGNKFSALSHAHYALYWTVFCDAGYVNDTSASDINPLANQWLGSIGTGLDFSTYYDTVLRGEFSFNSQGSPGFYAHFRKIF